MNIYINNIRINSISTIGSLNIGKTMLIDNQASSAIIPKPGYEEGEFIEIGDLVGNGEEENNSEANENDDVQMDTPIEVSSENS